MTDFKEEQYLCYNVLKITIINKSTENQTISVLLLQINKINKG